MKKLFLFSKCALLSAALVLSGCKKDKNDSPSTPTNPSTPSAKYVLVIDNGAQSLERGQTLSYSAHLVSTSGAVVTPGSVSWSSNLGGMTGNVLTLNTVTVGVVTASTVYEGVTYSASVPVSIQDIKSAQVFAVVPSAIIWQTNSGNVQLNTVFLGSGSASFSFSSDNDAVCSVSSTGLVSFKGTGTANIKVTGSINGQNSEIIVPVMVVGAPGVTLPVSRIEVTPALGELFRGEKLQLTAKAYNSNGDDVTGSTTFNYTVVPKQEDDDIPTVAVSVNSTGEVSAQAIGSAYVKVSANGVMGQSEIIVNPDTVIMVSPFFTTLGGLDPYTLQPGPDDVTLNATTYVVDRAKYRNKVIPFLNTIANPSGLAWDLPLTGVPQIDDMFKVVTLSNANSTSVKVTRIQGKAGSTIVVAHAGDLGGAASVMVNP